MHYKNPSSASSECHWEICKLKYGKGKARWCTWLWIQSFSPAYARLWSCLSFINIEWQVRERAFRRRNLCQKWLGTQCLKIPQKGEKLKITYLRWNVFLSVKIGNETFLGNFQTLSHISIQIVRTLGSNRIFLMSKSP